MSLFRKFVFGVFAVSTLWAAEGQAQAAGQALDFTIHKHYIHTRALGMGGAFTAIADDYAAIYYNPAGLARLEEGQMNFELKAMADKDFITFFQDLGEATGKENEEEKKDAIEALLNKNMGEHFSARLPTLGWHWARPGWGISLIPVDLSIDMEIHQTVGASASVVAYQDTTLAFSLARDLKWFGKKNRLSVGLTTKAIYRGYFNRNVQAADFILDDDILKEEDAAEGFTVDADVGLLYTPEVSNRGFFRFMRYAKPTFGFTVQNVADYGFNSNFNFLSEYSKRPPKLQRRYAVGSMFELPDFWVFKPRFAADLQDIGHDNWTWVKGSHAGFELWWKVRSWWQGGWRVGLNQGYLTTGFTGVAGIFRLDLATYGEEVGSSEAKSVNRRYIVQASLDF